MTDDLYGDDNLTPDTTENRLETLKRWFSKAEERTNRWIEDHEDFFSDREKLIRYAKYAGIIIVIVVVVPFVFNSVSSTLKTGKSTTNSTQGIGFVDSMVAKSLGILSPVIEPVRLALESEPVYEAKLDLMETQRVKEKLKWAKQRSLKTGITNVVDIAGFESQFSSTSYRDAKHRRSELIYFVLEIIYPATEVSPVSRYDVTYYVLELQNGKWRLVDEYQE